MRNQAKFDLVTLRAPKDDPEVGGDYYGLPWPCWGTPEFRHPGTPILYNTNLPVKEGGGTFRARFGVERVVKRKVMENGQEIETGRTHDNLLAEGSYSARLGDQGRISGVHARRAEEARLGQGPHRRRKWKSSSASIPPIPMRSPGRLDLSGGIQRVAIEHGCSPLRQRQGAHDRLESAGPDSRASRADLHAAPRPRRRLSDPAGRHSSSACPISASRCRRPPSTAVSSKQFPLILSSGRLVEYEGGGEETRSNNWLAELKQHMFVEINPADAAERGIKDGGWVWVTGAENSSKARMKALVTERVGKGVAWMPFHFAGWFEGADLRAKYPKGADPYRARREREYAHDLRLRPRDRHAGAEGHSLPDQGGVRGTNRWRA